ncbi:MAG: hypothetical protein F4Y49_02360 [Dehalococcoidia bacterium]|nr:hypothetical protein [Dehalococcoidia bacterium]
MATLESRVRRLEDAYDNLATKDDLERFATKEDLADLEERMTARMATKEDLEQLATKNEVNQLRVDFGPIKAAYVSDKAKSEGPFIAQDMGFDYVRTLNPVDMFALTRGQDLSGISRGDLRSFHRADLIIQVTDSQGQESYIAVEMSYTADERDTTRAVRNAEYLERFTGRPAKAAVAGLRRDRRIEDIGLDEVFWYELPESILEVE